MDNAQPADEKRAAADEFRARNDALFARRKELHGQITELRARIDAGSGDTSAEVALRKAERDFDDLTYEILTANYGLVRQYVAMFTTRSVEHSEDFESAGKVGLLWAISSYDPARGSFSSWAFKPIQREVLRAVRDADHANLTLGDFEKRPAILAAERGFIEEHGADTPVDYADIAGRAGVTEAQVRRVLAPARLESLQSPHRGQDEDVVAWEDRLTDPSLNLEEEVLVRFHLRALLTEGLPRLDARERYVLTRRFGLDGGREQSLRILGEQLGLSREGVRQIQQKALAKLKGPVAGTV
ncbi:sigma-70 family RNA polymerase sigma factor [Actinomadura sp. NAK00032]|uniref:sigma-70 family RNA polymerase sigma factor n=1 Tax=Actinomadura sp. NAK00032 TaxID=2742128 RepID=UPI0015907A3D|nr:sigma-70 family RNA polymerase sigma factor [Actinomadura sp. NAK00032]QKW33512.1 sigma-70 family RNA polymerase sigma factor [Actinomadura sp. NAK00032]